jgi:hypothetical protein
MANNIIASVGFKKHGRNKMLRQAQTCTLAVLAIVQRSDLRLTASVLFKHQEKV